MFRKNVSVVTKFGGNMEIMWDILASIYFRKCTDEELRQRDFLKKISHYGIDVCLSHLMAKGFIRINKKGEYVATSNAKKVLSEKGYFD